MELPLGSLSKIDFDQSATIVAMSVCHRHSAPSSPMPETSVQAAVVGSAPRDLPRRLKIPR